MRSRNSWLTRQVLPRPLFTVTLLRGIIIIIIVPVLQKGGGKLNFPGAQQVWWKNVCPKVYSIYSYHEFLLKLVKDLQQKYRNWAKPKQRYLNETLETEVFHARHGGPRLWRAFKGPGGLGHTGEKEETNSDGSLLVHSSAGGRTNKQDQHWLQVWCLCQYHVSRSIQG